MTQREKFVLILNKLKLITEDEFNLSEWSNTCGSVRCVIGHAATIPEFNQYGFSLFGCSARYPVLKDKGSIVATGFQAVCIFLGISQTESYQLFSPSGYDNGSGATLSEVIDRIEKFTLKLTEPANGDM